MRIGNMSRKFFFDVPTAGAKTASGQETVTYVNVGKMWGSFEPLTTREFLAATQLKVSIGGKIKCYYDARLVPSVRLRPMEDPTRILYIVGVLPDEANQREMTLLYNEDINGVA